MFRKAILMPRGVNEYTKVMPFKTMNAINYEIEESESAFGNDLNILRNFHRERDSKRNVSAFK